MAALRLIRAGFWRFASPSTLVLALLLFPLPWMEIQCRLPMMNRLNTLTRMGVPKPLADLVTPSDKVAVIVSQSGWQAARGECTHSEWWDRNVQQMKASDRPDEQQRARQCEEFEQQLRAKLHGSWLMAAYPIVMLTAIITGVALARGRRRMIVLTMLIAAALTVVALQHAQGLPLARAYLDVPEERVGEGEPPPSPADTAQARRRDLRYTPWFWLAQQLTVAALGVVLAEWWFATPRAAPMAKVRGRSEPPEHGAPPTA